MLLDGLGFLRVEKEGVNFQYKVSLLLELVMLIGWRKQE